MHRLRHNFSVYITADAGQMSWDGLTGGTFIVGDGPSDYNGLTYALGIGGLWYRAPRRGIAFEIAIRRFEGEGGFDANWIETNFAFHWGG
ncbi:MAG: hypothetical protein O7H41_04110 [Planctomycetota bacterium]|nr:hypothetical protein [Planctomycetota bacterium]